MACLCGPNAALAAAFAEICGLALPAAAALAVVASAGVVELDGQNNSAPTAATTMTTPTMASGPIPLEELLGRVGGAPCFIPLTRLPMMSSRKLSAPVGAFAIF